MPVAPAPCGFEEASRFAGHFSGSFPLSRSTRPRSEIAAFETGALMLPYAAVDRTSAGDATAPTG